MAGVRQFDEEAVLEQALAVFWQNGYSNTTMQELAGATGVQRGSLYNAYGDKETLFLRVFERYREGWLNATRTALDVPDAREALGRFLTLLVDSMTAGNPARGCLSTKTALGPDIQDPMIRHSLIDLLDKLEGLVRERLQDATLQLPAADAARLVMATTRGLSVLERIYQDKPRLQATAVVLLNAIFGPHH